MPGSKKNVETSSDVPIDKVLDDGSDVYELWIEACEDVTRPTGKKAAQPAEPKVRFEADAYFFAAS